MILEAALAIGGLVTTIAIGGPIASSMVRPHVFRRPAKNEREDRERRTHTSPFSPLDLGPDPMEWPSQNPWPATAPDDASWPSQQWEDEHFGRHWRDGEVAGTEDLGFHAMAARQYDATLSDEELVKRNEARARARKKPALDAPAKKPKAKARSTPEGPRKPRRAPGTSPDRRTTPSSSRRTPKGTSASRASQRAETSSATTLPARQVPGREELEDMIARIGLAGTVQTIMERTGWDFRKAAHYLARTRQG